MNTFEKNLKSDGKQFHQIPSNTVHDKILQNLNNPRVDYYDSNPTPLTWLLPIAIVFALVTTVNISLNTPNNSKIKDSEIASIALEEKELDQLVDGIENNLTRVIEDEQMAMLNDIKQFNNLFKL